MCTFNCAANVQKCIHTFFHAFALNIYVLVYVLYKNVPKISIHIFRRQLEYQESSPTEYQLDLVAKRILSTNLYNFAKMGQFHKLFVG